MKNFELISFASADELARAAAGAWLDEIEAANRAGKTHCVALSGGRIAQKFFAATVEQAKARAVSFDNVHFFWADERCVPPTDPDSNFKLANELLFVPLKISETQVHRLRGELPPAEAVKIAEVELRRFAAPDKNVFPVLDLIFLGLGEDGHVASLFPSSSEKNEDTSASFLAVENSPKPPPRRISMSYATLKAAKNLWILASGSGKETVLRASLAPGGQTPLARAIQSRAGRPGTKIFSDLAISTCNQTVNKL
jgi:6-phosphogluconolactonase